MLHHLYWVSIKLLEVIQKMGRMKEIWNESHKCFSSCHFESLPFPFCLVFRRMGTLPHADPATERYEGEKQWIKKREELCQQLAAAAKQTHRCSTHTDSHTSNCNEKHTHHTQEHVSSSHIRHFSTHILYTVSLQWNINYTWHKSPLFTALLISDQ